MSYRNPRFCPSHKVWLHRDNPASVVYAAGAGASFAAGRGLEKTYNRRIGKGCLTTSNPTLTIHFDPLATAAGELASTFSKAPMDRIIVARHNGYQGARVINPLWKQTSGGAWEIYEGHDGSRSHSVMANGLVDLELDSNNNYNLAPFNWLDFSGGNLGSVLEVGEVFYTRILQPQTGIAHAWEDNERANVNRVEMSSGNVYSSQNGPARRVWKFQHRGISEEDLTLYRHILAQTNYGQFPLWFDGPDSGTPYITLDPLNAPAGNLTPTGCTLSVGGNIEGAPGGSIKLTSTDTTASTVLVTLSTPQDVRDCLLEVDVGPDDVSAYPWAIDDGAIKVFLFTDTFSMGVTYAMGDFVVNSNTDWGKRLSVDLDAVTHAAIFDITGGASSFDPSRVTHTQFQVSHTAVGHTVRFGNLRLRRKAALPKYVEILEMRKVQDSPNPSALPTYRVDATLQEVLS